MWPGPISIAEMVEYHRNTLQVYFHRAFFSSGDKSSVINGDRQKHEVVGYTRRLLPHGEVCNQASYRYLFPPR